MEIPDSKISSSSSISIFSSISSTFPFWSKGFGWELIIGGVVVIWWLLLFDLSIKDCFDENGPNISFALFLNCSSKNSDSKIESRDLFFFFFFFFQLRKNEWMKKNNNWKSYTKTPFWMIVWNALVTWFLIFCDKLGK